MAGIMRAPLGRESIPNCPDEEGRLTAAQNRLVEGPKRQPLSQLRPECFGIGKERGIQAAKLCFR